MQDFLNKASKAYYEGNPFLSDAEYDALVSRYGEDSVGYCGDFKFPHRYRMYSLQKVYAGDKDPFESQEGTLITSPKLDGAAVSLLYSEGVFTLGLTRGDGKKGTDVTDKLRTLVPETINISGEVQVTGEVVCPSEIPNARNMAAGALNLKSLEDFAMRPLTFVAYDIYPKRFSLWSEDLDDLRSSGFNVVTERDWSLYPQDGVVFRIDENDIFESLGWTSHHPRGSYAFKKQQVGVKTKLLDVLWQVGKSGVVSPVAILDPVLIGEATVSRATLHNMRYINDLGLEIGCNVEVIRSGEIIPRILRRV